MRLIFSALGGILLLHSMVYGQATQNEPATTQGVSFSRDLAPVLSKRCVGCHSARRARQELRLDSFAGLMKGSENGEVVDASDAANSLILLKMKGEADGDRMPPNGQPVAAEMIAKIEQWIEAGAKFDGPDATMTLDALMRASRRAQLTSDQLTAAAVDMARKNWDLAFPGKEPEIQQSQSMLIVADKPTAKQLGRATKQTEAILSKALKVLGVPKDARPKGAMLVFFLPKTYDYGEWTQMVEKRSTPKSNTLWSNGEGFGYVVLGPKTLSQKGEIADEAKFTELVVAALLSRWGAPTWYAEGQGRRVRATINRRDRAAKSWQVTAAKILPTVKSSKTIFDAELPTLQADAMSWAFVTFLSSNKKRMAALHNDIRTGKAFEASFIHAYGAEPERVGDAWLKKFRRPKRKRGNYSS